MAHGDEQAEAGDADALLQDMLREMGGANPARVEDMHNMNKRDDCDDDMCDMDEWDVDDEGDPLDCIIID